MTTTIYGSAPLTEITQLRRRRPADADGNVLLRERFWNEDVLHLGPIAPALFDYAELVASGDPDNAKPLTT